MRPPNSVPTTGESIPDPDQTRSIMLAGTPRTVDRDALLKTFVDGTREATGTQACSVYLSDEASRPLLLAATTALPPTGAAIVTIRPTPAPTACAALTHRP